MALGAGGFLLAGALLTALASRVSLEGWQLGTLGVAGALVLFADGRIKRLWSIHQKLQRQRISLDQVYDFIALRVIEKSRAVCIVILYSPSCGPQLSGMALKELRSTCGIGSLMRSKKCCQREHSY